ncbi:sulfotransferase [Salinisphaera hydrothermalis C27AD]
MASKKPTHSSTFRASAPSIAQAKKQTDRRPGDDRAWHSLGLAYLRQERVDDAAAAFARAVELAPDTPEYREWIGHTLFLKRENDAALGHLDHAQQQRPDSLFALTTRARIHLDWAQGGRAAEYARRAADLVPQNTEIQALLAQALHLDHQYGAAIECFKRLCKQEPRHYQHWNNLGNVYRDLARIDEAIECYRKASELAPRDPLPFSNWITCLHYDPKAKREDISQLALEWQSRFAPSHPPARPVPADRRPNKQLRIGMLSDGFRQHPVGKMIVRCLENLSSVEFELFAYTSNGARDPLTDRIRGMSQQWLPVQHLSDDELAQRIRDDAIDIFFDLSGHNAGTRMRAVAMRPAPLIVKWVGGLINTTGVEAIDYLLSDPIETPSGDDALYSEKLIRMPGDYIVFDPPSYAPDVGELPARQNGYVTLGCFNNPSKLNDVTLAEWAKILHALPDARLMLKGRAYAHSEFCDHIYALFRDNGIERERLVLEGPGDNREMLQAYNRVDIALDPWPYSGGLTTCEGFLMGVPVVTLPGPTFAGRHSATHLINAGMPELVTSSWEEYRDRVVELARDLDNLATIRRLLRDVLLQSPVCDGEQFAQHFTIAMRAIWTRYCDDKPPAALTLDATGQAFFDNSTEPALLTHPQAVVKSESEFDWSFQGKIIAVDNGGRLLERADIARLLDQGALELVVFDPASNAKNTLKPDAAVHYYANNGLGDGQPRTLHACLDPAMSSVLDPLPAEQIEDDQQAQSNQVLTTLPFQTLALDDISGLPRLEWLVLDHLSNSADILEHGREVLKDTLLIQARVVFQPTHVRQPNLAELQHWASRNGFRLYRMHEPRHRGHMPDSVSEEQKQESELVSADALFLPDRSRIRALDENQRMKLAFLLHHIYGLKDAAYDLLKPLNGEAERYLQSANKPAPTAIVEADNTPDNASFFARAMRDMTIVNGPLKRRAHGLPGPLIISLTSYPARFGTLHLTLLSLLAQTVAPDRIVLWVAHTDRSALPESVAQLAASGLEIRYCEDLRSYKKIVPTVRSYPDAYIATADDDIYFPPTWLEELVDNTSPGSKVIAAHRIHRIQLDENAGIAPYQQWSWNYSTSRQAHELNFPTSGAGILFPPNCFHEDMTQDSAFFELCPTGDDIWLYWMARMRRYRFSHTGRQGFVMWPESQSESLFSHNIAGANDEQLSRMVERYGLPFRNQKPGDSAAQRRRGGKRKPAAKKSRISSAANCHAYDNSKSELTPLATGFELNVADKKILYTYIRKNACTSFKKLFVNESHARISEGGDEFTFMAQNHAVRSLKNLDHDYRIVVLRDPIERVYSLFKNKFIQRNGHEDIFRNYYDLTRQSAEDASFTDFVTTYLAQPWQKRDPHTYAQRDHLLPISYNCVIMMEELSSSMRDLLGTTVSNQYFEKRINSSSDAKVIEGNFHDMPADALRRIYMEEESMPSLESLVSDEARTQLRLLYSRDFDLLSQIES